MKKHLSLITLLLTLCMNVTALWADDVTYSPVLDVNFRTAAGNTAWNSGYPKSASDEGNTGFECNYNAGIFALQKYTVADLNNATKLVLTLTNGSGADAIRVWLFSTNDWDATSGVDDMVSAATTVVGVAPRSSEGTLNTTYLVQKGTKVSGTDHSTFTISGDALTRLKNAASSDGTFTLMLTDGSILSSSSRRFQSSNSANAEANRPTLVATIEQPAVVNKTTGETYSTLNAAFSGLTDADTELEVYEDQTLTGRCTWSNTNGHTLTITPKANITIKGHTNQMWFLVNKSNAVLNIGSDDYSITLDGENKTFGGYAVTKFENNAYLSLTNVKFQNFNLNGVGRLIEGNNNEGYITLKNITFSNCKNPETAFIKKLRVNNDKLILKGYLNIDSDCEGTAIYAASETQSGTVRGRIKIDDSGFTASNVITINWGGDKKEGAIVVIKTTAANAGKFQLTDSEWELARNAGNGDLYMTKPAEPTAQIGTTGYADLTAALAAAQDGETITLLADQEVSSRINVKNMRITIDGQGQYVIKRATSYTNGMLFLTLAADQGYSTSLTLNNLTIDGQHINASAIVMESSNYSPTTLNNVTFLNCVNTSNPSNHQGCIIVNKAGGTLTLNDVTFNGCTVQEDQSLLFVGTDNVTLSGTNTIPSIYISGASVLKTADGADATSPIALTVEQYGKPVLTGDASLFCGANTRLSEQVDATYAMPATVAQSYTHPGLLHTAADIARVKANLTQEPFKSAYAQLETTSGGTAAGAAEILKRMDQANWSATYPDYANFSRAATDAKLAYQLALRYKLKGSTAAATAAVNILNDWATNCKGVLRLKGYNNNIPDPNEYLLCIQAYQFANAAELLRSYNGWQAADFTKFQNWIRQTFADLAWQFLENHHGNENALHYWLNWDLAALTTMYSVGVLCDDKTLVDYALNYATNGAGNGNVARATVATAQDPHSNETLAQCQESGRDQGHATLDVTLLGAFCQMAQSQGTDLFTPYKALEMAEYVAKYNLMNDAGEFAYTDDDLPFTAYNNGEVNQTAISAEARGAVRPAWELFLAYAQNNDKEARYCQRWSEWARRQNAYGEANSSSNDDLGYGTLMYMSADTDDYTYTLAVSNAGAATLVLPFDATIPDGVEAYTVTVQGESAKCTEVEATIPANTPVLIMAAKGNYTFSATSIWKSGTPTEGALTGVFSKTIVPANCYILTLADDQLAFRQADGATNTVEANRAYLSTGNANVKLLRVDFGTVDAINATKTVLADETLYDLSGRKMGKGKLPNGLYITGGKIVVKTK